MQDRQNIVYTKDLYSPEFRAENPHCFTTHMTKAIHNARTKEPICAMDNGTVVYNGSNKVYLTIQHPHVKEIKRHIYRYQPDINTDIEATTHNALKLQQSRILTNFNKKLYEDTEPPTLLVDDNGKPILFDEKDPRFTTDKSTQQHYFQRGDKKISIVREATLKARRDTAKKRKAKSAIEGQQIQETRVNKVNRSETETNGIQSSKPSNVNQPFVLFQTNDQNNPPRQTKASVKPPVNKMDLNFLNNSDPNSSPPAEAINRPSDTDSDKALVTTFLSNPHVILGNFSQPTVTQKTIHHPLTTLEALAAFKK